MEKKEEIKFILFVIIVQILQFVAVYTISLINNAVIEFISIFISFHANRNIFGSSYHSDKLSVCTMLTLIIFYFLTSGVIHMNISLFIAPLFGIYLSLILNIANELIENQSVPKRFIKKKLRDSIVEVLGDDVSEENITNLCIKLGLKYSIAETVFLYLSNSKDEVAQILEIEGSTVIRRIKRFIEKATN